MRKLRLSILILLFLMLTSSLYIGAIPSIIVEYEIVSQPSYIRDGDTFEIPNYPAIRLADINCPEADEYGGSEATYALTQLIDDRTVYLDVDDIFGTGPYGRLICLVYVDYNSTHLLNVNLAMVELGEAYIIDYDNQWNPYTWTLLVTKPTTQDFLMLLAASAIISLVIVVVIDRIVNWVWVHIRAWIRR